MEQPYLVIKGTTANLDKILELMKSVNGEYVSFTVLRSLWDHEDLFHCEPPLPLVQRWNIRRVQSQRVESMVPERLSLSSSDPAINCDGYMKPHASASDSHILDRRRRSHYLRNNSACTIGDRIFNQETGNTGDSESLSPSPKHNATEEDEHIMSEISSTNNIGECALAQNTEPAVGVAIGILASKEPMLDYDSDNDHPLLIDESVTWEVTSQEAKSRRPSLDIANYSVSSAKSTIDHDSTPCLTQNIGDARSSQAQVMSTVDSESMDSRMKEGSKPISVISVSSQDSDIIEVPTVLPLPSNQPSSQRKRHNELLIRGDANGSLSSTPTAEAKKARLGDFEMHTMLLIKSGPSFTQPISRLRQPQLSAAYLTTETGLRCNMAGEVFVTLLSATREELTCAKCEFQVEEFSHSQWMGMCEHVTSNHLDINMGYCCSDCPFKDYKRELVMEHVKAAHKEASCVHMRSVQSQLAYNAMLMECFSRLFVNKGMRMHTDISATLPGYGVTCAVLARPFIVDVTSKLTRNRAPMQNRPFYSQSAVNLNPSGGSISPQFRRDVVTTIMSANGNRGPLASTEVVACEVCGVIFLESRVLLLIDHVTCKHLRDGGAYPLTMSKRNAMLKRCFPKLFPDLVTVSKRMAECSAEIRRTVSI